MKSQFIATIAAVFATAASLADTPDKFVRYVEATGSQYVDTGVTGRWNTKIEAQVEWMNFSDSAFFSAGDYTQNTRLYLCYTYKHGSESSYNVIYTCAGGYLDEVFHNGSAARWEKNRIYDYSAELTATNGEGQTTAKIKVDGLEIWNKASAGIDTGVNFFLFANNRNGTANSKSKTRCYRLKIWQGSRDGGDMTLVRDLIPCVKNGRAGLWDAKSGDILYGAGSDLVSADENSEVPDEFVEYVESTGVNFIDTEVEARSGTEAEIDLATLHNRTLRKGLLGAIAANGNYFDLFHSYEAKVSYSYGTRQSTGGSYSNGDRYHVVSSLSVGSQTLTMARAGSATTNTVLSATDAAVIDTGLSLYLFGRNSNGNIADSGIYRLYGLKIKQNGAPVRDFRPCLKNGEFALYDTVSKRIFHAKRGLLNGPLQAKPAKVKNLVFVDYIESSGNETLDTGVRARAGTRAKGEFAWAEALRTKANEENTYLEAPVYRNGRAYLGADDPIYWPSFFFMMYVENRTMWGGYGNGLGNNSVSYGATAYKDSTAVTMTTAGTKYSFDASFLDGAQTIELNGAQVWSLSNDRNYDSGRNLHVFSTGSRYRSAARCYGLEIWQDGEKVRDFKPCIYEGKAALYDKVTGKVYLPSPFIPSTKTSGIILSGDEKPVCYVEYVESDGTIFVDTGVKGKSGTVGEMKVRLLETGDAGVVAAYDSSVANDYRRLYLLYNLTKYSNAVCYGYGANQTASSFVVGTDYDVKTSLAIGEQTFIVNGTQAYSGSLTKTIDTGLNLYAFAVNMDGLPKYPGKTRLYSLKLWQGNADGSNMQLVRNFKPVKLTNGLVVLWDFKNKQPYLPQLVSSPGTLTQFPVIGPDGDRIRDAFMLIVH